MPVEKMVRGGIEPGITYCNNKSLIEVLIVDDL